MVQQKKVKVKVEQRQWERLFVCVEDCENGHYFVGQKQEKLEDVEYVYFQKKQQKEYRNM